MATEHSSEGIDEAISALIDGDLASDDARRLLDRMADRPELRARWARYHAVRSTLEGAGVGGVRPGFAARVRAALDDEPTVLVPRPPARSAPAWVRPVAGFAIAASVALVAVGGLLALQGAPGSGEGLTVASLERGGAAGLVPPDAGAAATTAVLTGRGDGAPSAEARRRIGIYLANHSEFSDAVGMPGVLPHSRLTGFNAGQ